MTSISGLAQEYRQTLQSLLGTSLMKPIRARVGRPSDEAVGVTDSNRPDNAEVFIHFPTSEDPLSFSTALRGSFKLADLEYGQPVLITMLDSGSYMITDFDPDEDAIYSSGSESLPSRDPVYNTQLIDQAAIIPSALDLSVIITSGMFGRNYYGGGVTPDFSTETVQDTDLNNILFPSAGQAIGILIQVDAATGTLSYKQNFELPAILSLQQMYNAGELPDWDSGKEIIGYLKLVAGMTVFTYDHIWQPKPTATAKLEIDDQATGEKLIFPEIGAVSEIAEGVAVTATDGTHVFEADGTVYTVEVLSGVVASVTEAPVASEDPELNEDTQAFVQAVAEELGVNETFRESAEARIKKLEDDYATAIGTIKDLKAKMSHKDDRDPDPDKDKKVIKVGGKAINLDKINL